MSFSHFWMQTDTEAIRKHNLHEPIRPERAVHEKHIRLADVNGTRIYITRRTTFSHAAFTDTENCWMERKEIPLPIQFSPA